MSSKQAPGWECRFCFEQLKRCPTTSWQRRLRWVIPVRRFRCPHCFNTFQKPAGLIAAIPFVRRIFCEKRGVWVGIQEVTSGIAGSRKNNQRNYVNANLLVRFSRWTDRTESRISDSVKQSAHTVWVRFMQSRHWLNRKLAKLKAPNLSGRSRTKHRPSAERKNQENSA